MKELFKPLLFLGVALLLVFAAWRGFHRDERPALLQRASASAPAADPLALVLTPMNGESALDQEIRQLQTKVKDGTNRSGYLERLGWAFVSKARLSSDPGFYNLAEQAAKAIFIDTPADPAGLLLLGHVYDAQHRFAEAEQIARELVARREFAFDFALLGDALMEQGKLVEAVAAYQKMVDLKPSLQAFSRIAHMRWLKGDLPGAKEAISLAVSAGNPREPEPTAWAYTRLAFYQLQAAETEQAATSTARALQYAPDYAPALLMRGRVLLAQGKQEEALSPLQHAAEISPLPDYLWTLADALRAVGNDAEAEQVEGRLSATGATADPRTFALFLATRGEDPALALRLASSELTARQDVFTHDAVAWAQLAAGDVAAARESMRLALEEGTQDARLLFHAGAIAAAAGDHAEALQFYNKARAVEQTLLPSERQALATQTAALIGNSAPLSVN